MHDRIEKAFPGKKYQYVGYSRSGRIYYIFKLGKKGNDWHMRTKDVPFHTVFSKTLKELNDKLGSL